MTVATLLVAGLELYAIIGISVASIFLTYGIGRIDEAARHTYAFRLLILPGVILLWPIVLARWSALAQNPEH
jgi:hypothetical protein